MRRFEAERALQLVPPDGEFAVMNYRSTYPFKPPFRVTCTVDDDPNSALKVPPPLLLSSLSVEVWQGSRAPIIPAAVAAEVLLLACYQQCLV